MVTTVMLMSQLELIQKSLLDVSDKIGALVKMSTLLSEHGGLTECLYSFYIALWRGFSCVLQF